MKCVILVLLGSLLASAEDTPVENFIKGNNLFATSVYKELVQTEKDNFLFSPFSAETVLAFVQSGSEGQTAEELRNSLHLPNHKQDVELAVKSLITKIKGNDVYTLHTANKMYVKDNFPIKDEFKTAASVVYNADIETIEFTKKVEAAETMNHWVEDHTNNKIKNLIDSRDLDEDTRAVLINALYFKANWSNPFSQILTFKQKFHKTANETIDVDTLFHSEKHFKYYESSELKAKFLELPFDGREASMVIVLPDETDGIANLDNHLEQVFTTPRDWKTEVVNVLLPKFRIETSIDFKEILEKLGVRRLFNQAEADLSGISGKKGDLYVDKAAQKTFIDVNEGGVEAAAATYLEVSAFGGSRPTPKMFAADHPYIFYIKVDDLILFAGRVTDPSKR